MRRYTVRAFAWWRVIAAAVAGVMLASACGSSGTASSGASSSASASATGHAMVCQDVAGLRTSLSKLSQISVSKGAASTLAADARDVQARLTTLAHDAGTQWSTQTGALKSALSTLQEAVTALGHGGSLGSVGSALASVKAAAQKLLTTADEQCPTASTSP